MMSGDHPLLELLEVNNSPSGIAKWLDTHPDIDITSEINGTTVFYHLLERPDVHAEAVDAFIKIPGNTLQRICKGKRYDIPLIHYINSYNEENGRKISESDISVLKLLIYVTDDINIGDVNRGEAALVICLRRKMFPFAKALLEADGINAHIHVNGERNGIITMLAQSLLQMDTGFVNRQWDAEREEVYQLLFHKQIDINDKQLKFHDAILSFYGFSNSRMHAPLFHFLIYTDIQNINKFDKLKAICLRKDFNPNVAETSLTCRTALMAVLELIKSSDKTDPNWTSLMELLDILLKNEKLDVNLTNSNGMAALMITEDLDAEQLLLKHDKIDINLFYLGINSQTRGQTKLRQLLLHPKKIENETVRSIMEHPTYDINRVYRDGKTDLIWAISRTEDISLVSFFLKSDKVDISLPDINGQSPLCFAAQFWRFDIIKLLMEHPLYNKSMLKVVDKKNKSFLHHISMHASPYPSLSVSDYKFMQDVINQADINVQDEDGFTPLMRAIENNNKLQIADIVYFFFSHPDKCDLSKKNRYRETALDVLNNNPTVNNRVKTLILDYAGKRGKSVEEFSIGDHIQSIQMKISESGLTSKQKEQLQFMLKSFGGVFESLSSGGELDSSAAVRKKLMDNYWYILENLEVCELIEHLFSKTVITENERELIRAKKTRMYKASKLMEILLCRGERCYEAFIQSLIDTCQEYIVDEINRPKSSASTEIVPYEPHDITIPVLFKRRKTLTAVTFKFDDSD